MSVVTENQPDGTATWIDLGVPDLDRALDFYGRLLGRQFDVGPAEYGRYTTAYLDGGRVAALTPSRDPTSTRFWWNVYLAAADCDATAGPVDEMIYGRLAQITDPFGAGFSLIARSA